MPLMMMAVGATTMPLPDKGTLSGEVGALVVKRKLAVKLMKEVGEKVTVVLQVALGASEPPQVVPVSVNPTPTTAILEIVNVSTPVFLSTTVCGAEVNDKAVSGKVRELGTRETNGPPPPVPVRAAVKGLNPSPPV